MTPKVSFVDSSAVYDKLTAAVEPVYPGTSDDRGLKSRMPKVADPAMSAKRSKLSPTSNLVESESRSGDESKRSCTNPTPNVMLVSGVSWLRAVTLKLLTVRLSSVERSDPW